MTNFPDDQDAPADPDEDAGTPPSCALGIFRTIIAGALMGIANIIPGLSGGTMILTLGLYERFVDSVADVTRLKFRFASLSFLGILGATALLAIFASVKPINWGLTYHQHVMFALFIGLTLGGVPLILREIRPLRAASVAGIAGGVVFMVILSLTLKQLDLPANFIILFGGGIIGSAAMVLPGISGSYLLLVLGLYFPITSGIEEFKEALKAMDLDAAAGPAWGVMFPVGLGVLAGIAGLTNLLKFILYRFHHPTMGGLLGLLLGSVVMLYPFKEPGHKDPFEAAAPLTPPNVFWVVLCIAGGFAATFLISRMVRKES